MTYIGDFAEDATVQVYFTTNDSSGGAIAPSDAFESVDVAIYKDSSNVQKTTTNGLLMTSPFDSVTGLHHLSIDTSVDTGDIGFWAVGSDYVVMLNPDTETVDGQTVVSTLREFSIENRTTFPKADFPTNFADLAITVTNGEVTVGSLITAAINSVRDAILSDSTSFPGANIDVAISSRATQANILSDATPFAGANIDTTISSRSSHGDPDPSGFIDVAISSRSSHGDPDPSGFIDVAISSRAAPGAAMTLSAGAITAATLALDALNAMSDNELDRDMGAGTDSGTSTFRTMRQALRYLRNFNDVVAGTLTVRKEDDATTSWVAAVGTSAGDPINSINPAGGA